MKMAVDRHRSSLRWMAETMLPIQLSPCAIELPLCWEFGPVGVTKETAGKVPLDASVRIWEAGCHRSAWLPPRHS